MAYDATLIRLPDPTTYPEGPGWNKQTITDKVPGMVHSLNKASVVTVQNGGQYWEISITYPELTEDEAQHLISVLYAVKGSFSPFYVQLPNMAYPSSGVWDDTKNGTGLLTTVGLLENQVKITDTTSVGGVLSVGDALKLSNSDKIYKIIGVEEGFSVTPNTTLTLNCDILGTVDAFTYLEPNDVKFRVKLTGQPSFTLDARGLISSFSLTMRETLT